MRSLVPDEQTTAIIRVGLDNALANSKQKKIQIIGDIYDPAVVRRPRYCDTAVISKRKERYRRIVDISLRYID